MHQLLLALVGCLAFVAARQTEKRVVCYFGSWSVYRQSQGQFDISKIDPSLCSHLIYSFVGLSDDATVKVLDPWQDLKDGGGKDGFGRFTELRKKSPSTKIMVAMGGWNEGSVKYAKVAADTALRSKLVDNIVQFLKAHNFDGFDLDWEYPTLQDKENYVQLLKELRQKFDEHSFILSAAVGAGETTAAAYKIGDVSKYLHFINLMTYDFHGSFDANKKVGHNAPLYSSSQEDSSQAKLNVDAAVKYWLSQGAAPDKLNLGIGSYGRSFTLADPNQHKRGAPFTGPGTAGQYTKESGMLGYNEICELQKKENWQIVYDKEQHVPYAYNGNQIVGYDDVSSVKDKIEYAKKMKLGGTMMWSIETDDFNGVCGEKYPLLKTLNLIRSGVLSSFKSEVSNVVPYTNKIIPEELSDVKHDSVSSHNSASVQESTSSYKSNSNADQESNNSISDNSKELCQGPGIVRDPHDCSKFYHCVPDMHGYLPTLMNCPENLFFDAKSTTCNYKDLVQC